MTIFLTLYLLNGIFCAFWDLAYWSDDEPSWVHQCLIFILGALIWPAGIYAALSVLAKHRLRADQEDKP